MDAGWNPGGPATGLLGREPTKKQGAVTHGPTRTCLVLPRDSEVASVHLLIQKYHHRGKKHLQGVASSVLHPPSESCPTLEEQTGKDNKRSRGWPWQNQQHPLHWPQISMPMTFFANLARWHTANGPRLHCSERRIVSMNSLIKHVSFLFSIFPLSNRVKIFPAVWKWLAGRGDEFPTLLGAFSIWRKWLLSTLLSNRADHPIDN